MIKGKIKSTNLQLRRIAMHLGVLLLVFLSGALSINGFAQPSVSILSDTVDSQSSDFGQIYLDALIQLYSEVSKFRSECFGSNGVFLKTNTVRLSDTEEKLCDNVQKVLKFRYSTLNIFENPSQVETSANENFCQNQQLSFLKPISTLPISTLPISTLEDICDKIAINDILFPQCRPGENTELFSKQCAEEAVCNIMRGIRDSALPQILWPKKSSECLDSSQNSNCITELSYSVFKGLYDTFTLFWKDVKGTGEWAGNKIISSWKQLDNIENATSEAVMIASTQGDGVWQQMKEHPVRATWGAFVFVYEKISRFVEDLNKEIKNNYGCEKWSGPPHTVGSTCLQGMKSWDCATCNQRRNVMCSIIGVLGSQYLTGAFITRTLGRSVTFLNKFANNPALQTPAVMILENINDKLLKTERDPKASSFQKFVAHVTLSSTVGVAHKIVKISNKTKKKAKNYLESIKKILKPDD